MATIHDVMPAFELFQPTSIDDALSLLVLGLATRLAASFLAVTMSG